MISFYRKFYILTCFSTSFFSIIKRISHSGKIIMPAGLIKWYENENNNNPSIKTNFIPQ